MTHSTRRFLKTAAPVIGSAGMLFAFYQWMVSRKGQAVEEMEYVQIQERELLKDSEIATICIGRYIKSVMIIWIMT